MQKAQKAGKSFLVGLLIFFIGFSIYSNTFDAGFQFDDTLHIKYNEYIKIRDLKLKTLYLAVSRSPALSRPVANLSFALNSYFFGLESLFWFHFINILIHCLSALGLYLFIFHTMNLPSLRQRYGRDSFSIALFSALLFLTHAVQTQAVTYIVQRMTGMAAMFYIYSLFFYALGRSNLEKRRFLYLTLSVCCGAAALGSKEIAVTLPLFILLYEYLFISEFQLSDKFKKRLLLMFSGMAVVLTALIILYWPTLKEMFVGQIQKQAFTIPQRLLTEPRVVFFYISLLFLPLPSRLNVDHDFAVSTSLVNPLTTVFSITGIFFLIAYAVKIMKTHPLASFCILWFFGNLFLESSLIPLAMIFEQRVYLPSMGFFLLIVSLLYAPEDRIKKAGQALLLVVILCNSWFTYQRNFTWKTPETLWRDAALKSPNLARPHSIYAQSLLEDKSRSEEILAESRKALAIDPNTPIAYENIGRVYAEHKGLYSEALEYFEKALEVTPQYRVFSIYFLIGETYDRMGDDEKAIEYYKKGLAICPPNPQALKNLASFQQKLMNRYRETLLHRPEDIEARYKLAEAYVEIDDFPRAVQEYETLLSYDQQNKGALNNLGSLYMRIHNYEQAEAYFQKILEIDPQFLPALINLGIINMKLSRSEEALMYLEKASELSMGDDHTLVPLINSLKQKIKQNVTGLSPRQP